jgi:hypothetical protein
MRGRNQSDASPELEMNARCNSVGFVKSHENDVSIFVTS